jgi:uncharacterized protein YdaL
MARYDAVFYIGSAYDEPLPQAFLDDVLAGDRPVMWLAYNLWQLGEHAPDFAGSYGFTVRKGADHGEVTEVRYKDTSFTRDTLNEAGIANVSVIDEEQAETVATAVRPDGSTVPWAVRSGNLTYVGEIPYNYTSPDDRYVAFTDMLYDLLAPDTPERHRALVRIEDVGPMSNPDHLRRIADLLHDHEVPFSIAVYPVYRDPRGVYNHGVPRELRLQDRPAVVEALNYMVERGGTIVLHGYTHQYSDVDNPYDAVSGNDYEFYLAHVDENDFVQLDGPVPEDSPEWVRGRLQAADAEMAAAGLPRPDLFEFPHYASSVNGYRVVAEDYRARYDRGLYFPGVLTGGEPDYARRVDQFVPYPIRDVYGSLVVPENLGEVTLRGFHQHPPRPPDALIESAERNLVVRDGVASFFYHPFLAIEHLERVVVGIKDLGYEFVPADAVIGDLTPPAHARVP